MAHSTARIPSTALTATHPVMPFASRIILHVVSSSSLFFSRIQISSRLRRIDFPVHPAPFQQLGVGAAVHQRAAVHDKNHVAVHGGGHPLGDDQLGLAR